MVIKNIQNMISECIAYADEITGNPKIYPADARMALKDLLRYDMMVFLGYLYEPGNEEFPDQIEYIKTNLRMILSEEKFLALVEQKCNDPRFLTEPPKSLTYFVEADRDPELRATSASVAKSKFVVDTFRKLGEGFIAYDRVRESTKQALKDYVGVLNDTLNSAGIVTSQSTSILRADDMPDYMKNGTATFSSTSDVDLETITSFDEKTGEFVTKKAIGISGRNIQKKAATDVSEFLNFKKEEDDESKVFKRGEGRVGGRRGRKDEAEEIDKSLDELIHDLQGLIGLGTVKEDVMHLINIIKVRKLREMRGYKRVEMSFHLVFTGNPGTGKTTIARLLAKIYKQLGLVSKGQFIEVDRSGLVDHFAGGTALKTTNVINRAIGGILFIDEAYTLTHKKDSGDYGQEAIDTLLKRMEDDRDDFIVIVAGYTNEMTEFIESNPGLKSRFNKYIYFPDYNSGELMEIFKYMCKSNDYILTQSAADVAETYLRGMSEQKIDNFANARLVRNYFERCVDRQATRIIADENINDDDLITLLREDMIEETELAQLTKMDE